MRAVIICGGAIKDYSYIKNLIKKDDVIICADSGYDHAIKMQLDVNLLVGDFDSIKKMPTHIESIRYPTKKDMTDVEIALEHARKLDVDEFLLLAATGSRMDHTLTNIMILKDCLARGEYVEIIDEHNKIMITDSKLNLHECNGSIVSLIPITDCFGVTTQNMEYTLQDAELHVGSGLGVSNIMTNDYACVAIRTGLLLVIVAKD